jgi:dTDP-4-dehydrorhamnose reductase
MEVVSGIDNGHKKVKILVTGANGQLGTDLCLALKNENLIAITHQDLEITDINAVDRVFKTHHPDVIINPAAWVDADDCEVNPDKAFKVNSLGVRNIAVVAREINAKLVQISTDYVFGGENRTEIAPLTEFDLPVPISVYGKSKLLGEKFAQHFCNKHFIVRVSGLFGVAGCRSKGGSNFVEAILKQAKIKDKLAVVNDQFFSPTSTMDLASKIAELIHTSLYGIFHITNKGVCTWHEFAEEIIRQAGLTTPVLPVTSDEYPMNAKRPHYSALRHYQLQLLGMDNMRPWQLALESYLKAKGHNK